MPAAEQDGPLRLPARAEPPGRELRLQPDLDVQGQGEPRRRPFAFCAEARVAGDEHADELGRLVGVAAQGAARVDHLVAVRPAFRVDRRGGQPLRHGDVADDHGHGCGLLIPAPRRAGRPSG
ncbi:hypothetical protein ACFQQB_61665 [Nonomuraea rubra]|uniref:hypothetical protein n=1 Tax=Nonomuraea rubra TaxID=46180 RepID=UPI003608515A